MNQAKKIQELELEIQKLKSRIRIDRKERTYEEQLVFLSKTALDFLSPTDLSDFFEYIGKKLLEMIGHSVVFISSFDPSENQLNIRYFDGIEGMMDKMVGILGHKPRQQKINLSEKTRDKMLQVSNKLYKFEDGLFEASDGTLSRTVCAALERLMKVKEWYGIVFERDGQLFGTAIIGTKDRTRIEDPQMIEAFIFQCSIAFHRQQLEAELREAKKEAETSNELKTAFLANMSHEIRTPMNGILGLTSLLADTDLSPKKHKEYLDLITSSGNVLLNLLDGIMDISRIEANQVIINREKFNLNQLIRELNDYYLSELVLIGKDIKLSSETSLDEKDAWIYSDQVKVRQILVNLISNAVKFARKGDVDFGYKLLKKNKELLFHVHDTGPGIKPELQEIIFGQFIQGDNSSTRQYRGSGLGLAICKGFLDLMGGKIWLESDVSTGSTFYFTLPYEKTQDSPSRKSDADNGIKKRNWEGRTVLIVEDDYINYKLLESILKRNHARVLFAVNGKEAVRICLGKDEPDLVLMDIQLPVMNGLEAIRQIRKTKPDLPIIVQTANVLNDEKKRAEEYGCQGFIIKPVNLKYFMDEVGKILEIV